MKKKIIKKPKEDESVMEIKEPELEVYTDEV